MIWALMLFASGVLVGAIWGEREARKWRTALYEQRVQTSLAQARLIEYQWREQHPQPPLAETFAILEELDLDCAYRMPISIHMN